MTIVKLLNSERVLEGRIGDTYIVNMFTPSSRGGRVAHVRDYRFSDSFKPFRIWSLGPEDYEIVYESEEKK